jgi:hypothetical protein
MLYVDQDAPCRGRVLSLTVKAKSQLSHPVVLHVRTSSLRSRGEKLFYPGVLSEDVAAKSAGETAPDRLTGLLTESLEASSSSSARQIERSTTFIKISFSGNHPVTRCCYLFCCAREKNPDRPLLVGSLSYTVPSVLLAAPSGGGSESYTNAVQQSHNANHSWFTSPNGRPK